MTAFLIFATATIGLTNIIVDSSIFAPVRKLLKNNLSPKLYELFECHQCMGTWAGLFCGVVMLYAPWLTWLLYAFSGSFLATITYVFYEFLISKTDFELNVGDDRDA